VAFQKARPGDPWPARTPGCLPPNEVVSRCSGGYPVFASREAGEAVARVEDPSAARVRWSELPRLGEVRRAHVGIAALGLELGGWAPLGGRLFPLRRKVEIVEGHVWISAGTSVEIVGTTGDRVVVSARTPFARPGSVEASTSCDSLGAAPALRERSAALDHVPYVTASKGRVDLRATPGGPVLLSFERGEFPRIDRQSGYARIVAGEPAWRGRTDEATVVFDGWVSTAEIEDASPPEEDRDSGCDVLDRNDTCALPRVLRDTPVFVGGAPGGPTIGLLRGGAEVRPGERRGDSVAFELSNAPVTAPPGKRFWIHAADLGPGCVSSDVDEDGCPRCDEGG